MPEARSNMAACQSNPDAIEMGSAANIAATGGTRVAKNPTTKPTVTTVGSSTNKNSSCAPLTTALQRIAELCCCPVIVLPQAVTCKATKVPKPAKTSERTIPAIIIEKV